MKAVSFVRSNPCSAQFMVSNLRAVLVIYSGCEKYIILDLKNVIC